MTNAPERIWAWFFIPSKQDDVIKGGWNDEPDRTETEYLRADLCQPKVKPPSDLIERAERLRLEMVEWGMIKSGANIIRDLIAALQAAPTADELHECADIMEQLGWHRLSDKLRAAADRTEGA